MKQIPLTQGKYVLVDDEDFEALSKYKWYAQKIGNTFYAVRILPHPGGSKRGTIYMHREIVKSPKGLVCDHINLDGLDNRKMNLRVCSHSQNQSNVMAPKNNTSGFKGVSWDKRTKRWAAYIMKDRKKINLGIFVDKHSAYKARTNAAKIYHGEFAHV